ncbi:MAG: hypothetical protein GX096_09295 [Clostridiales bacterium]|nr:hypothetical protein [Clostridiales bacterium]
MSWALIRWELKKVSSVPMFAVFLVICFCFNTLLVLSSRFDHDPDEYAAYVTDVTGEIGGQMGAAFDLAASDIPASTRRDLLIAQTRGAVDILDDYDAAQIYHVYSEVYQVSGSADERLEQKFIALGTSVKKLAELDASLSVCAAGMTKPLLDSLFGTLCRAVITQGMLLAVLIALYSCGYEGLSRTETIAYSTKTGRSVQQSKLVASAIASLAAYVLLALASLAVFEVVWELGSIWNASMSSQFYYVSSVGVSFPFLTWSPFTVGGYLLATLLLGAAVVLIFHLLGFASGLLVGNTYYGFMLGFVGCVLNFGAIMVCGDGGLWTLYQLIQWTPISLWWGQTLWFTGLELGTVIPYQECCSAMGCLLIIGLVTLCLYLRFTKKDVKEIAA